MKKDLLAIFYDPLAKLSPLKALKEAISKNEDAIMDLNRQQLDKGKNSAGESLGEYANFFYKGRWYPVDLKLEGDFREKFSLEITDKHTEIFSQDWKYGILVKKYGKDIFGIAKYYIPNMQDLIKPDFQKAYRNQLK